jgi:hypothetical protein
MEFEELKSTQNHAVTTTKEDETLTEGRLSLLTHSKVTFTCSYIFQIFLVNEKKKEKY